MTTYLKKRKDVKSVFGTYTIEENKVEPTLAQDDNYIADYLLRNGGRDSLQKKLVNADKFSEALSDPSAFILRKAQDLSSMVATLKTLHNESFKRYSVRNIPLKEVRAKVKKDLDEKFKSLLSDHEEDFPKDLVSRAITKAIGN